jgi:uncharacterized protein involved in exopolysaccharide biosynthesis
MSSEQNTNEIDLRQFLEPLKGNGKVMLKYMIGGAGAALIFTLVSPPIWRANATILTVLPSDLTSSAGQSLASALSPNAPDPLQVLEGVIMSRRSFDLIIKRTGIRRRDLENGFKTDRKGKQATITLSWEDKDKNKALAVVQGGVDGALMLQHEIGLSAAELQAKYLEESVKEQDAKLHVAESKVAEFETNMKAPVNPGDPASVGSYLKEKKELELQLGTVNASLKIARSQAKLMQTMPELPTIIPSTKAFRDKLIDLEYQLHIAETTLGPMAPKVVALKEQIRVTKDTLNQEINRYLASVSNNLDPTIATLEAQKLTTTYQLQVVNELAVRAPTEAVELARLAREVVTLGTVSATLRGKWEEAKVAAKVDQVKWALLEPPYIEDLPTNKRYARNPFIGIVLGMLLGTGVLNFKARRGAKKNSTLGADGQST